MGFSQEIAPPRFRRAGRNLTGSKSSAFAARLGPEKRIREPPSVRNLATACSSDSVKRPTSDSMSVVIFCDKRSSIGVIEPELGITISVNGLSAFDKK